MFWLLSRVWHERLSCLCIIIEFGFSCVAFSCNAAIPHPVTVQMCKSSKSCLVKPRKHIACGFSLVFAFVCDYTLRCVRAHHYVQRFVSILAWLVSCHCVLFVLVQEYFENIDVHYISSHKSMICGFGAGAEPTARIDWMACVQRQAPLGSPKAAVIRMSLMPWFVISWCQMFLYWQLCWELEQGIYWSVGAPQFVSVNVHYDGLEHTLCNFPWVLVTTRAALPISALWWFGARNVLFPLDIERISLVAKHDQTSQRRGRPRRAPWCNAARGCLETA